MYQAIVEILFSMAMFLNVDRAIPDRAMYIVLSITTSLNGPLWQAGVVPFSTAKALPKISELQVE